MQRWLQAYGGGVGALVAFQLVTAATLYAQVALDNDLSWNSMSSVPTSTLDAHIGPQDLELRSVADLVGCNTATNLQSSKLQGPSLQGPSLVAPARPESLPDGPTQSLRSKSIASPFKKWVSPNSSRSKTESNRAEVSGSTAGAIAGGESKSLDRVARRIKRPDVRSTADPQEAPSAKSSIEVGSEDNQSTSKPKAAAAESPPKPTSINTNTTIGSTRSNLPPLTARQRQLRTKIRRVLTHYYNRPLNTRDRSPWEMMHAVLSYEVHSKVLKGGPRGEPITVIGWLCYNQSCKRRKLMYVNDEGELRVRVGPALQGHRGQFLAMLAQSKVSKDYPIRVDGHEFTVADLIKMEMKTCYPRSELTFKLIGLMHYLKSDTTWMNDQGMEWDIPRMIAEELRQPVRGAACGGTHRLSGLTLAYKIRQKRGEPVDGEYLKAQKFIARYQQYAYRLQNRDGSFSTEWFRGPGNDKSPDRNLKTTGHLLEWLLYAATEKELRHRQTAKAANYLANLMYNNRYKDWDTGPLGHAIHALLLYDRLVFSAYGEPVYLPVAGKTKRSAAAASVEQSPSRKRR